MQDYIPFMLNAFNGQKAPLQFICIIQQVQLVSQLHPHPYCTSSNFLTSYLENIMDNSFAVQLNYIA